MSLSDLEQRAITTIRFVAVDGVQKANSGHPGLPLGAAAMAYTIWKRCMRHNPTNPNWHNRDRFILSGGHGSMLLYSLLYLTGYPVSLDDLKQFRQWGSITPGHPEYGLTPGVETTTGPLGQGFANGVGMAIAERHLAAIFTRPGFEIVNHYTYAIVTDGDLMEGVASEAASLAGHLKLGKLIYLYDDNRISIDGSTDIAFTEDRAARFSAYGWHVQNVPDGNDVEAIQDAIQMAQKDPRPSIIICRTHIGYSLPTLHDTPKIHGSPPGLEELHLAKKNLNWPIEPDFYVPEDVLEHFREAVRLGSLEEQKWNDLFEKYRKAYPELATEYFRRLNGELPDGWEQILKPFPADEKGMATRAASGKVINSLAPVIPELIGGSADLAPSNNTWIEGIPAFQAGMYEGRNFHFGVREHSMGSIINGMALHKGVKPYGATFLVFADYMRPAIRVAAISHIPSIWIFTHDSIGLGEDGPTHQPVEHLAALRAIPNLLVIRPADANEVLEAWKVALTNKTGPTIIILSRQSIPVIDRSQTASASNLHKGAYILKDFSDKKPQVILMASGSEVVLSLRAADALAREGILARVVSFPSWELFAKQERSYQEMVLPHDIPNRISIEMGIAQGWERWIGAKGISLSIEKYGASAPEKVLFEKYGFTVENVCQQVKKLLGSE